MKTLNSTSLKIQKSNSISFIENVILYNQFEGIITEIISVTSVKIQGNATSFFSNGDSVLCPLKNFETEYTINSIPTYSSPDTTLSFSSGSFDSSDIGRTLSLKIKITDKLIKNGIKRIKTAIEGTELNGFDSGYMDITADNSDNYFINSAGNGLFQSNNIFWLKYTIKFKGSGDTDLIYFGGLVDLTDFNPDFFNKTITIRIYGHSYELKRYAAYNVINENETTLTKIGGINILSFSNSDNSEPGIKKINYKPFDTSKLSGIEVTDVSNATTPGIKVLEFKYPYYFKWDNGDWTKVAKLADTDSSSGSKKLYDSSGTEYATVKFGNSNNLNEYPDSDDEIWVSVKNEVTEKGIKLVSQQGTPTLQFNNGNKQLAKIHIQRVLKYVSSTITYTDESDKTNSTSGDFNSVTVLENNLDEIILVNEDRFWGAEFILSDFFTSSSISIHFSVGGNNWSSAINFATNGLVDNTNGFLNNGKIIWTKMDGWFVNNIVIGSSEDYKGYMVKFVRNTASGTCLISEIKKTIRLNGQDDDFLEVNFDQNLLLPEDVEDDIIIKYEAGTWKFGTWYNNVPIQYLLEQTLEKSNYGSAKRILSDMKIDRTEYEMNIWGKPPKYNYIKYPTAVDIDFENEIVYVAVGLEIWKAPFKGLWEYLGEVKFWGSGSVYYQFEIKKIWHDTTYIYIYTTREYSQKSFAGYFSRMIISTGSSEQLSVNTQTYGGRWCQRDGTQYDTGTNYYRMIGHDHVASREFGENLCIPYQQNVWVFDDNSNYAMYPAPDLDSSSGGFSEWYFYVISGGGTADNSGSIFRSNMGFFKMLNDYNSSTSEKPPIGVNFTYGQQGCEIADKTNNKLYVFTYEDDKNLIGRMHLTDLKTGTFLRPIYYNEPDIPICHVWDESNDIIYFGHTSWYDVGFNTESFSYISRYAKTGDRIVDISQVFHFNYTGSVYSDITSIANSGGNMSSYTIDEVGDIFYFGHNKKFRNLDINFSVRINDYEFQYWNGTLWTALEHTNESDIPNGLLTFHIPYDWAETTVNGSNSLWYIRIRCTAYSLIDYAISLGIFEEIIWDSELDNGGVYSRYMPIWLSYDTTNNIIHGTMFNRDPLGSSNPFQWVYFVYDLNYNICIFQNVGNNYTFDGTYLMKDFVYDSFNNCVHFIAENIRYKDKPAYLVKGEYFNTLDKPYTVVLTKEAVPRSSEWGSKIQLISDPSTGNIYGITKSKDKIFWEYSKSFYPRIELAAFSNSDSVYNILKYISEIMNSYYIIHSERNIRFLKRETYNGDITLKWDENMIAKNPSPGYWKHKYDSVHVSFQNPFSKEYAGIRKKGFSGWNRNVLAISNILIQNDHLAKYIVDNGFNFFNKLRLEIDKIAVTPLIQVEMIDRASIIIPNKILEIDENKKFIITNIILESNKNLYLKILEIN